MSTSFLSNSNIRKSVRGGEFNQATSSFLGTVRPDGTTILVNSSGTISVVPVTTATTSATGTVRPDGTSILVTSGLISANIANTNAAGIVRPDGTSVLVTSGVVSVNFNVAPYATSSTRGVVRISVSGTTVNIFTSD